MIKINYRFRAPPEPKDSDRADVNHKTHNFRITPVRPRPTPRRITAFLLVFPLTAAPLFAATLHHQGVIAVNGERFTGTGGFRFAIIDPNTDEYLWTNDGSTVNHPDPPANSVTLTVTNGVYNARLGDTDLTNMTDIPEEIFATNDNVALRIWFDDQNGHESHQLSPDLSIVPSPYATQATSAEKLNTPGTAITAVMANGSGQVGIGTDDPQARLDVAGNIRSTGLSVGGNSTVTGDAYVVGGAVFGGNIGIGTITPTAKLDVVGTTALQGDVNMSGNLTVNNDTFFVDGASGQVGVGTANPSARLDVDGPTHLNGDVHINSNLTVDTDVLFVDGATDNVGVGTDNPESKLDVNGAISGFGIVPIGSIIAWHKNIGPNSLSLPDGWMECNGDPLPEDSPLLETGATSTPNLNGDIVGTGGQFLRGASQSGNLQQDYTRGPRTLQFETSLNATVHSHEMMGMGRTGAAPGQGSFLQGATQTLPYGSKHTAGANIQHAHSVQGGDLETRPYNMSIVWIIRVE